MLSINFKFENIKLFLDMFILRVLFQNTAQKVYHHKNKANVLRLNSSITRNSWTQTDNTGPNKRIF